ncbi:MAG: thioesterase domain-containing protein, partial [Planctomycetia bacterium]
IVLVDALPLSPSGKIDRSRLPDALAAEATAEGSIPPSTTLERHIATLWQEALGREQVGVNQNFFDLGGTSLQAATLTVKLGEQLGVHVPTALLFDLADIGQIARRLVQLHRQALEPLFGHDAVAAYDRDPAAAATSPHELHPLLVPLKPEGDLAPLFMVHPPGGIVACYRELARLMNPARPLYAIRSRGIHGDERLPETLAAMAGEYAAAIRSLEPNGPYLLGGWSLGGVIAAAVAAQLVAAGGTIDRLVLLDSALPDSSLPADVDAGMHAGMEYGLDVDLEDLSRMSPEEQLPFLFEHARRLGVLDTGAPEELATRVLAELRALFAHHVALCEGHRLDPCPIDAVLFRPRDVPFETGGPEDRGWGRFLRSVDVRRVPGLHHSMVMQPHVAGLAAALDAVLAEAVVEHQTSAVGG